MSPKISVLMPVFNAERFLPAALASVLGQTFGEFELIVVDDESKDQSRNFVKRCRDSRIKLIDIGHAGLVSALNQGLAQCSAPFIARMDADDICAPERFAMQLATFDQNPQLDIICSDIIKIDENNIEIGRELERDINNEKVKKALLYRLSMKPIVHPSVMFRRKVIECLQGYRDFQYAEDHDFWLRASDHFQFHRINRPLLRYRINPTGISQTKQIEQSVSGCLSNINHIVRFETGVDIYIERPDLMSLARSLISQLLETKTQQAEAHLGRIKAEVRAKRTASAAALFGRGVLKHGAMLLPMGARRMRSRLVQQVARAVISNMGGR